MSNSVICARGVLAKPERPCSDGGITSLTMSVELPIRVRSGQRDAGIRVAVAEESATEAENRCVASGCSSTVPLVFIWLIS